MRKSSRRCDRNEKSTKILAHTHTDKRRTLWEGRVQRLNVSIFNMDMLMMKKCRSNGR